MARFHRRAERRARWRGVRGVRLGQSAFAPRKRNSLKAQERRTCEPFRKWLRGRPCRLASHGGCWGDIQACHVDYAGQMEEVDPADGKGMALKVHDRFNIPMCQGHHKCQTDWSWARFEANFRIDAYEDSKGYWTEWLTRTSMGIAWARKQEEAA